MKQIANWRLTDSAREADLHLMLKDLSCFHVSIPERQIIGRTLPAIDEYRASPNDEDITRYLWNCDLELKPYGYELSKKGRITGHLLYGAEHGCHFVYVHGPDVNSLKHRAAIVKGGPEEVCCFEPVVNIKHQGKAILINLANSKVNGMPIEEAMSRLDEMNHAAVNYRMLGSDVREVRNDGTLNWTRGSFDYDEDLVMCIQGDETELMDEGLVPDYIISQKDIEDRGMEFLNITFYYSRSKARFSTITIPNFQFLP